MSPALFMTKRLFIVLCLALLTGVLAACGGSGTPNVPSDSVALVNGDSVSKAQFLSLMAATAKVDKVNKQTPPKAGTPQYKQVQDRVIGFLVQLDELTQRGKDLGVNVTDPQVEKQIYKKVTANVKVTPAQVTAYYNTHKSSYTTAASRDVRHILVNSKSLAEQVESQLKGGASFATLAKKYSKDPSSAKVGGKLTITKGETVPQFDKVAFTLKTGATSPPVHTRYGWHIIQALSAVKPAATTPLSSVKDNIQSTLLQQKKSTAMNAWLNQVKKDFEKKVVYAPGYTPATTTSTTSTTG